MFKQRGGSADLLSLPNEFQYRVFVVMAHTIPKFNHTTMIKRLEVLPIVHLDKGTFFLLVEPERGRELSQSR